MIRESHFHPGRCLVATTICVFLLFSAGLIHAQTTAAPTIPKLIRFSGVARDLDGKPLSGVIGISFSLYAEQTGGAALWMEIQNVQADASGHYSVLLGSTKPEGLPAEIFNSEQARWIGVQVEQQAEQPRSLLVSAPYALKAGDAETLGGLPPSAFLQAAPATNGQSSASTTAASRSARAGVINNTVSNVTTSGGSANKIALFTAATNIQNSVISQKGSEIGIGTAAPTHVLEVNAGNATVAQMALVSTGTTAAISLKNTASGGLEYWIDSGSGSAGVGAGNFGIWDRTHNAARLVVDSIGQVGIGTKTPGSQLEVDAQSTRYSGLTANGGNALASTTQTGSTGLTANGGTGDLTTDASGNGGDGLVANGGASTSLSGSGIIANGASGQMTGEGGPGISASGGIGDADGAGGIFSGGNFSFNGDGIDVTAGSGFAGSFTGDVSISGNLSKGGGSFKIDHPLDPANKYLYHSFVESPDMKNIYDGVTTLDPNGEAVIRMPEWFGALNRDVRYQLTCIGGFAPVYVAEELANNQFKIAGGRAGLRVSWQVTGIRQDVWANAHRIPVEEAKNARERGYYIHPELYGAPPEKQIEWARHPLMMKKIQRQRQAQIGKSKTRLTASAKP